MSLCSVLSPQTVFYNCRMDCHHILYRYSWSPQDEALQICLQIWGHLKVDTLSHKAASLAVDSLSCLWLYSSTQSIWLRLGKDHTSGSVRRDGSGQRQNMIPSLAPGNVRPRTSSTTSITYGNVAVKQTTYDRIKKQYLFHFLRLNILRTELT